MNEIEVKILEIDQAAVEKKLLALGAQKTFDGALVALAFDYPDERLAGREELLRLRQEGPQAKVTYKKLLHRKQVKISEELEVAVSDMAVMKKIFLAIGLKVKRGYPLSKHRRSYVLGAVHFEFDTFPHFPTYLEIEAPDRQAILTYAAKLGFANRDLLPWGVREVFAHYGKSKKSQK